MELHSTWQWLKFWVVIFHVIISKQHCHPVIHTPVAVFLDSCHMLKLVRNTLSDKKSMVDSDNNFVQFENIEKLHKVQISEGLHLGNKLRPLISLGLRKK